MRQLTSTLLAAQKQASGVPYVQVKAVNTFAGAARLAWERLYSGGEDENSHSLSIAGDGSMIRVRASLLSDSRKLYRQRVVNPGPGVDFSNWIYTGQYNCVALTSLAFEAEVYIFWVNTGCELRYIRSTDYGASWQSSQLIDYTSTNNIYGFSAAVKPGGDIALFYADQDTLLVKRRTGGNWQSKSAWNKSTGDLSGVAAVYGTDWNIVVSGKDASGNYRIWSLVYGDGGEIPAGEWSALKEFAAAPSDGDFEFRSVFMDRPDVNRCFYIEKYTGIEAYSRPFLSQTVAGGQFSSNLWLEPVPFDLSCSCGLAMAHHGCCCWLSAPGGVWKAEISGENLDLSGDVLLLEQETEPGTDRLKIQLRNDDGRYGTLPSPLGTGCRLEISPGYITGQGIEVSPGQSYVIDEYEYVSDGGKAVLNLYASGGWSRLSGWTAGSQFRFNGTGEETSVREILEFVLSRPGFRLEVISQSSAASTFCPDFTIHSGAGGSTVTGRLLSFVPDVLFFEGDAGFLLNPLPSEDPVYSYGQDHPVVEGRYRTSSWKLNRVTVEGYDPAGEIRILKESFAWPQLTGRQSRAKRVLDRNIGSLEVAEERGGIYLKEAEAESENGVINIPVNCGQQLHDVIEITDARAGLAAEKKRISGIKLIYDTVRGEYRQILILKAV